MSSLVGAGEEDVMTEPLKADLERSKLPDLNFA